jgi:hypothetical protein
MTDPTSRQRGRPTDNTVTVKQYQTSGHEPLMGLDTKTDWPAAVGRNVTLTLAQTLKG